MAHDNYTPREHWKCFVACFLLCLSPFQYGLDFGLIGGFQAMVGFLEVESTMSSGGRTDIRRSSATASQPHLLDGT
jgi:hypothetical protein